MTALVLALACLFARSAALVAPRRTIRPVERVGAAPTSEATLGTTRAPFLDAAATAAAVAAMRRTGGGLAGLSDADLAWFARDRRGDAAAAAAKAEKYAAWRADFGGLGADRAALDAAGDSERRKRVGYLARGTDALGRPVVVVVARRHDTTRRRLRASQALCLAVLEDAVAALGDGGEQVLAVVDLRRVGPAQVDIPFLLWLVAALRAYYPKRLGQVALVDPPPVLFEAAWELIKPAVGRHAKLVRLISSADLRREYFPHGAPPDLR